MYKNNASKHFRPKEIYWCVFIRETSPSNIYSCTIKWLTYRLQRSAYKSFPDDNSLSVKKKTHRAYCIKLQECRNLKKFRSSCFNMLKINCETKNKEYKKLYNIESYSIDNKFFINLITLELFGNSRKFDRKSFGINSFEHYICSCHFSDFRSEILAF